MTPFNKEIHSLILRNNDKNNRSYNNFQWPESGTVECSDWKPTATCGNGLHGLLWGKGNWSLLRKSIDDKWLVVQVLTSEIVHIDKDKVKFPRGEVIYCGNMAEAMSMVLCHKDNPYNLKSASSGNYSQSASSGNYSRSASSGYASQSASSGDYSQSASSGYNSRSASSGYASQSASSGDYSQSASSGNYSRSASSGDGSRSVATGKHSISAVAGLNGCAAAGEYGCFSIPYFDGSRNRIAVGIVGENGIEADTLYQVSDNKGTLIKVQN